ncbi:MAG TPA: Ig-like domain-containing protein, partial [Candidatus Sulfotelmatobacter sp.]|nr:Ig-like domain-containing protein [Candidatus Sulfotelmatobacter sp.]
DGLTGTGAAPGYFPVGAQWDNLAITKASDFIPPQSSGSGANLRPTVAIYSPADGESLFVATVPAVLPITASAADFDGTIAQVEFYADATKVGQATASPYSVLWSNVPSGSFRLTAVATDNRGAATVSAPVSIATTILPQPVSLSIASLGTNVVVFWPTSATASSLQYTANLAARPWKLITNAPVVSGDQNAVTLPNTNGQQVYRLGAEVDPGTLSRKLMMGYQGWFACPQDGSPLNQWVHWFRRQSPVATNVTVDFWPDISELGPDELFATSMTLSNGPPAQLYSAYNRKTVVRHFKWMKDNHLDGVFLQRFSSSLSDAGLFAFRNQVTVNVRAGAEAYGRVFAIMYDISGQSATTLISTLTNDWAYLVNTLHLTESPYYVRHKGKPVVAIWGFGFTDRPGTPQDAQTVIDYFKAAGCTVLGGVPTSWRTLKNDSQTNAAWAGVYRSFDIISPWSVGRYGTLAEADNFKQNQIVPDLTETKARGIDYMPVIFPGFSWTNLNAGPLNQIPRNGGSFYWRQAFNTIASGSTMLYGAMFDEVDEGTAIFKLAPTRAELPVQGSFVPLNIDGQALPSDWYLRVADQASRMLRQEIPLQSVLPIRP